MTTETDTPRPATKVRPKWDFVPVIFANGVDDDLPGFAAAVRNERVQYGDKIYEPGDDITVWNRRMAFSCGQLHIVEEDTGREAFFPATAYPGGTVRVVAPADGRDVIFMGCVSLFNIKRLPG